MANTGLRAIALIEGAKSLLVLAAGTGVLALAHHSLQESAEALVRHLHLNPASKYPRIFIEAAANLNDTGLLLLAGWAFAYSAPDCGWNAAGPSGWACAAAASTFHSRSMSCCGA